MSDLTTDHPDFARAYPFLLEPINSLRTLFAPYRPSLITLSPTEIKRQCNLRLIVAADNNSLFDLRDRL